MAQTAEIRASEARLGRLAVRLNASLEENPRTWTAALLLAGFFVRLYAASGTFLNSDEALHFSSANHVTWSETYRASLSLFHPPLLIFLLHLWRALGTSELMLRLPSVLAGMAFCWFGFRWLGMLFRMSVAWTGFVFLLFLPSSIELSTEVRQYALLLAFAAASAYLLEDALKTNSAGRMLASGVALALAISSHFSAFLFATALGLYAIWRLAAKRFPMRLILAWGAGQILSVALSYFFYVTQIAQLGRYYSSAAIAQGWMGNAYLSRSYFVPGRVNPILFALGRTIGVFQYAFRQRAIGDLAFILFVAGLVIIFRRTPASAFLTRRQLGFLLTAPFLLNCAAAFARKYPYGGTRHCAFLILFAVAGTSVALVRLVHSRLPQALAAALGVALISNLFTAKQFPYVTAENQRKELMRAALDFIHREVPSGEPVFADAQTSLLLGHYLCDQHPLTIDRSVVGYISYECDGHRVIASVTQYIFTARSFYDQFQDMTSKYRFHGGARIWVAQMGWDTHVAFELAQFPLLDFEPHWFGTQIQLFALKVGQPMPDRSLLPAS